ncbi:chain-length determining protein [Bacteroides sp.]|uniref:chain-length determining protein n=1 Tax=Bacteroides sp. TaxID=29523 RepID=UPI00262057F6|nr:chain-length determining protein [Bacteroides sp.]MDD3037288.1 chain-length determining protein [Bacteroides sp.]
MPEQQLDKTSLTESRKKQHDEFEIDLMEILRKIIFIRKTLYKAAGVGLLIGVIIALSIPKLYTVNVMLSPEMGRNKGNNGLAGLDASFLGSPTSGGDATDALNAFLSSDIVSSTPFLLKLLAINIPTMNVNTSMDLNTYLDEQSVPWWSYVIGLPNLITNGIKSIFTDEDIKNSKGEEQGTIELTKEQSTKIEILRKSIAVKVDNKTAITNVTITLQNPKVAAIVADSIVNKLQECIIAYRISKAKEDCAYLEKLFKERQQEYYTAQKKYANYVDAHDNLILQSVRAEQERLQSDMSLAYQVYSQVANQLQVGRAKVQEEKPVFAVVEPAVIPLQPSGVGMKIYILLFSVLSVICTMGWLLIGRKVWASLKYEIKRK